MIEEQQELIAQLHSLLSDSLTKPYEAATCWFDYQS